MTKRKRRLLTVASFGLLVLALAAWFEPTCVVKGWLRGEAFYDGRPTSYWSRELARWRASAFFSTYLKSTIGLAAADVPVAAEAPARWNPFADHREFRVTELTGRALWVELDRDLNGLADVKNTLIINEANFDLFGYTRQPGFVDKAAGWLGVTLQYPDRPALLNGDPQAAPVLRELLHDADEVVRGHAERALSRQSGPVAPGFPGRVMFTLEGRAQE